MPGELNGAHPSILCEHHAQAEMLGFPRALSQTMGKHLGGNLDWKADGSWETVGYLVATATGGYITIGVQNYW